MLSLDKKDLLNENAFDMVLNLVKDCFVEKPVIKSHSVGMSEHRFSDASSTVKIFFANKDGADYPYHVDIIDTQADKGYSICRQPNSNHSNAKAVQFKEYTPSNIPLQYR